MGIPKTQKTKKEKKKNQYVLEEQLPSVEKAID